MATRGSQGLSPAERVRQARDFRRALRTGRRCEGALFTLVALPREDGAGPRLGLSVTRRLGGAVQRNRAKRLLREAFRRRKGPSCDLLVLPKPALVEATQAEVGRQMESLLRRLAAASGGRRGARPASAD